VKLEFASKILSYSKAKEYLDSLSGKGISFLELEEANRFSINWPDNRTLGTTSIDKVSFFWLLLFINKVIVWFIFNITKAPGL
jgi:hypothetical protein